MDVEKLLQWMAKHESALFVQTMPSGEAVKISLRTTNNVHDAYHSERVVSHVQIDVNNFPVLTNAVEDMIECFQQKQNERTGQ